MIDESIKFLEKEILKTKTHIKVLKNPFIGLVFFFCKKKLISDMEKYIEEMEFNKFYNERQMEADFDKEIEMIKLISTTNLEDPVEKEILYKKIMMLSALLSEAKRQKVEQFAKKVFEEIK